ncbi:MAG: ATP synthase F1 subunit epsilon [Erysipelotrichaceae bacterium]|nr:ATP synthase F1 subunit epsilon [Erysipelotrichaceae bacterium]MDE6475267.1 ATP synthase F1 subunit epsilon [Erysipelotrichaceae bacterium]
MLSLKIITPTGLYKTCDIEALHVKTVEGELTLLPHHMPIVAMLTTCKLSLRLQGVDSDYAINGGMLHLHDNHICLLTDTIESKEEIDIERANRAKERAEARLSQKAESIDIKRAELALQRALNRVHVYHN